MLNYNFRDLLSAFEFECFSRDLLNAHENLALSSFAEGRDGGIDLRCSIGKGDIIVQAKRYKEYNELKTKLKKEVEKVNKLQPERYIITTSVDLTAANKKEIMEWFHPYIQKENDIIAKQDLNRLLGLHPEIEKQYYKLWLTSTNVLNTILHKNIVNWAAFEKQEILETIKTYVMNDSFDDAFQKLVKNRYVVISGEPGIGKTTLARVLIMHLLSDKYKEVVSDVNFEDFFYTNSNIEDFVRVFEEEKRQVFFYDDFLGQISLEEGERGFENRIIRFIKVCQTTKDKLFILTTREYILQQGLSRYPAFSQGRGIEMSKCVVDMGKYTRFVRAQILYNHLVASEIPQDYINAIIRDKNYLKIIDHQHFSPRIIETFIGNGTHDRCRPEEYYSIVLGYFDHPDSVWLDAFCRLNDMAQESLLVLNTMPVPVLLDDWKDAYCQFFKEVHKEANYFKDQDWKGVVKVLQDNFIKTGRCPDGLYVDFHNPGIKDVLVRYIKNNEGMRQLLLDHVLFVEQFFGLLREFRLDLKEIDTAYKKGSVLCAFDKCWGIYRSCRIMIYRQSDGKQFYKRSPLSRVDALSQLKLSFGVLLETSPLYVEKKVNQELMSDEDCNLSSQLSLLEKLDLAKTTLDLEALFRGYCERLFFSADCLNFALSIKKVFPNHIDYLESEFFNSLIVGYLEQELGGIEGSEIDELDSTSKELCKVIPELECEPIIYEIKKASQEYSEYIESQIEEYYGEESHHFYNNSQGEDAWKIDNLFDTMKE